MFARFGVLLLLMLPGLSQALQIENGKRINRTCALCHGDYGQGTPGTMSPRLAGLPANYLEKELRFYRSGKRNYAPMVIVSSIKDMSDEDIRDISEYLAGVNLRNLNLPNVPPYAKGDPRRGREIFNADCKECHRETGLGKAHKGIPPLAGQYGSYIFSQMEKFQSKERYHDDDPDDETFDGRSDEELADIIAYLTSLPVHPSLDKGTRFAREMAGMQGVASMAGQQAVLEAPRSLAAGGYFGGGATNISGRFRITPAGNIVLNPLNQDMRAVAGLSGEFRITSEGILFAPD